MENNSPEQPTVGTTLSTPDATRAALTAQAIDRIKALRSRKESSFRPATKAIVTDAFVLDASMSACWASDHHAPDEQTVLFIARTQGSTVCDESYLARRPTACAAEDHHFRRLVLFQ